MAVVTLETPFPQEFRTRAEGPIDSWLTRNENHNIVQKYLAYYGAASVSQLTSAQKGAVFSAVQIWQEVRQIEKNAANEAASATVETSVVNDFSLD